MFRLVAFAVCVLWVSAVAAEDPKSKTAGWKPLFDGKTLDGWKPSFTENSGKVNVKDGDVFVSVNQQGTVA